MPNESPGPDSTEQGKTSPLSRPIPWKWVVIAILGYMLVHNLILWINTR